MADFTRQDMCKTWFLKGIELDEIDMADWAIIDAVFVALDEKCRFFFRRVEHSPERNEYLWAIYRTPPGTDPAGKIEPVKTIWSRTIDAPHMYVLAVKGG